MKFLLLLFLFISTTNHAVIVRDPKLDIPEGQTATHHDLIPEYNPHSIFVPSTNVLKQLPPDRVLDFGASAYALGFNFKALYFYTNAVTMFADNPIIVAQANYEAGYVYHRLHNDKKALEYFNNVINTPGASSITLNLANMMATRINNKKEYKVFLKQEDVLFLEDKKSQRMLDKQISKEEQEAAKRQRALAKERKRREREEKKAQKQAEAERKRQEAEAKKSQTEQ